MVGRIYCQRIPVYRAQSTPAIASAAGRIRWSSVILGVGCRIAGDLPPTVVPFSKLVRTPFLPGGVGASFPVPVDFSAGTGMLGDTM
jgi:hypothetical protein